MANLAMNRPEVIQSLIDGVDRYNPDNISILEEYLTTQCQNEEYDLMANLAALKLYGLILEFGGFQFFKDFSLSHQISASSMSNVCAGC